MGIVPFFFFFLAGTLGAEAFSLFRKTFSQYLRCLFRQSSKVHLELSFLNALCSMFKSSQVRSGPSFQLISGRYCLQNASPQTGSLILRMRSTRMMSALLALQAYSVIIGGITAWKLAPIGTRVCRWYCSDTSVAVMVGSTFSATRMNCSSWTSSYLASAALMSSLKSGKSVGRLSNLMDCETYQYSLSSSCIWLYNNSSKSRGGLIREDVNFYKRQQCFSNCTYNAISVQERQQIIVLEYLFFKMYDHLNVVSDHPHIPQEAFLLLPTRTSDLHARDDFRVGFGKKVRRLLHEGWAVETFTPFELQKLQELEDYLKEKKIALDKRWDKSWRLRFLISTGFNLKKCVADMDIFIRYQHSVKDLTLSKHVAKHLKDGVFYIAGRDCRYRPILIFDVDKIIKSGMTEDQCIETQTYFFQYVMRNFLIPGQVENWVAIIDVAEIGLFSLVNSMKKSFTFLADTYRSRMCVCYVVRIPASISFIWTVVKRFLDEDTVIKINFFDDQKVEPLLEYCNPSQLEKKFGGTLENIAEGHFWPPREVSKNYKCQKEPVRLLTKQEYTRYYRNKIFYNTKFHEQNIIPEGSNQRRDNTNLHILKRIEKEFKLDLDMTTQDTLNYNTEIKPFSDLKPPLNYLSLLQKHKASPQLVIQT